MCHRKNPPALFITLLYLPMKPVSATPRAVFPKLQSLGVIPSILGRSIGLLPTLSTGKMNNNPRFSFSRHNLLYDAGKATGTYRFTPLPNSKA